MIFSHTRIVQPDIVFIERARLGIISGRGLEGAPSLGVEIRSPWTTRIDRVTKRGVYARFSMPCYWIVDTDARIGRAHV